MSQSRHSPTISTVNLAKLLGNLAPRAGFEPATLRLTAGCSAVELPRNMGWDVSGHDHVHRAGTVMVSNRATQRQSFEAPVEHLALFCAAVHARLPTSITAASAVAPTSVHP